MHRDIRFLLVFLIIVLAILVWLQNQQCTAIPNSGSLNPSNTQHFTMSSQTQNIPQLINPNLVTSKSTQPQINKKSTSKFVDNILRTESKDRNRSRFLDQNLSDELDSNPDDNLSQDQQFSNPIVDDVNTDRNSIVDSDQQVLDELIKEVNTGNDLIVDNPRSELYKSRSRSINSAKKYRKVSYKDSGYRYDFDEDGSPSQTSQDELNSMYSDALVFRNNEYNTNGNFKGMSDDSDQTYGNANLNDFTAPGPQTQQEKVMSLYNSNEYLPNNDLLDRKLTKGFQILDNPVAVSNPNLIPVLKSIPVSSVMGSNRNQTYDIRSEPPCPKTVVSPFLNSSIMPDIYSTQRGCL